MVVVELRKHITTVKPETCSIRTFQHHNHLTKCGPKKKSWRFLWTAQSLATHTKLQGRSLQYGLVCRRGSCWHSTIQHGENYIFSCLSLTDPSCQSECSFKATSTFYYIPFLQFQVCSSALTTTKQWSLLCTRYPPVLRKRPILGVEGKVFRGGAHTSLIQIFPGGTGPRL